MFERIANDPGMSAVTAARLAAEELAESIKSWEAADPASFWKDLMDACRALVGAGRGAAPVVNLASHVLAAAERVVLSGLPPDAARHCVTVECEASRERADDGLEALGRRGSAVIPGDAAIAVAGADESVMAVLRAAKRSGKNFDVIVPVGDDSDASAELVCRLDDHGIGAVPSAATALPTLVGTCDSVLVGAESVSENDFTSAAATRPVLIAARRAGIPARLAALTDEFIPAALRRGRAALTQENATGETAEYRPQAVRLETLPLSYIEELITEEGLLGPRELPAMLAVRPVAPPLLEILFAEPRDRDH